MKIAIVQPYLFPYIGYFQLVNLVDTFVFYDDVQFKKKGFINRNSILINGKSNQFTIPCKKAGRHKLINEIQTDFDREEALKFLKSIRLAYSRAPYFNEVYELIASVILKQNSETIADLAIDSVITVSDFLGMKKKWLLSSQSFSSSRGMERQARLIQIASEENASVYVNPEGGMELYDANDFKKEGVDLKFIISEPICYKQFNQEFIPQLSIIDVLMFNSVEETRTLLNGYKLI